MRSTVFSLLAVAFPSMALASTPVFTYGPASNYHNPPAIATTATGSDLLITPTDFPNGIPEKGIDFFLGPDLQSSLKKILNGACAGQALSQECLEQLSSALDQKDQYAIESRVVGAAALLGEAGAFIVAMTIKLFNEPQPVPLHVHLEPSDVRQMSTIGSTAVLATATGASNYITVTMTPTPTSTVQPATISTLTADASGHHKGDVLIALPTPQADTLKQLLRKFGAPSNCKSNSSQKAKRSGNGPNFNAISNVAQNVLIMAAPGQLLEGLGLQAMDHLPALKATIEETSLKAVQAAAAGMETFKDVAVGLRDLIAETVWIAAYDMCVYDQIEQSTLVLEDSLISDDPDNDDNKKCTTDDKERPTCDSCAGTKGICQSGDRKSCKCVGSTPFYTHPGDESFVKGAYTRLQAMFELKSDDSSQPNADPNYGKPFALDSGEMTCGASKDQSDSKLFFSLDTITAAANDFCEDRVNSPFIWAPAKNVDPKTTYYKYLVPEGDSKVLVSMTWVTGNMSCPPIVMTRPAGGLQLCKDRFGLIINNCDTTNPSDSKLWKQGGYYDKDCVHWYIGGQH